MPDLALQALIQADFSDFQSKMQAAGGAVDDFASHASTLEQAYADISGPALQASQSQDTLANAMMGAGKAAEESSGGFASMATAMAAGVAGGFGLSELVSKLKDGFKEITTGTWEWGESLKNLSISTGLSTDQVQTLKYAADITGVSADRLIMLVNRVSRAMTEFAQGNTQVTAAADALHLDPSTWTDAYDGLTKIGEKIKEIGQMTPAEDAAVQALGGGRLIMQALPALERVKELREEAANSGIIKTREQIEADDQAAEAIHRVDAGIGSLWHDMGAFLSETIIGWGALVSKMGEANGEAMLAKSFASLAPPEAQQPRAAMTTPESAHGAAPHESKAAFEQEIADQKAVFGAEMAGAGDTAVAREKYQSDLADYLKSKEFDAAMYGIDLSKEITAAKIGEASAAKSVATETASAEKSVEDGIAADLRRNWTEHYNEVMKVRRDELSLAKATAEGEISIDTAKFNLQKAFLAQELEQHKITKAQETQGLIDAENVEYTAKMEANNRDLLILDVGTAAFATAMAKRDTMFIQHQTLVTQTQTGGDKGSPFGALGTSVTGQFESAFTSIATKAQTTQQFLQNIYKEMASDFIHLGVRMVTESKLFTSIFSMGAPAAAGAGAGAAGGAAAAGGGASAAASSLTPSSIAEGVKIGVLGLGRTIESGWETLGAPLIKMVNLTTLGNAFASGTALNTAGIWIEAQLQTAWSEMIAMFAALKAGAFQILGIGPSGAGGWDVPSFAGGGIVPAPGGGTWAILHQREMVLPRDLADKVRNGAGGGGGSGDTHHYHINLSHQITAMDAKSFGDFAKDHYSQIMDAVEHGVRQAHPAAQKIMGR